MSTRTYSMEHWRIPVKTRTSSKLQATLEVGGKVVSGRIENFAVGELIGENGWAGGAWMLADQNGGLPFATPGPRPWPPARLTLRHDKYGSLVLAVNALGPTAED